MQKQDDGYLGNRRWQSHTCERQAIVRWMGASKICGGASGLMRQTVQVIAAKPAEAVAASGRPRLGNRHALRR